jgi:hypothetical protein
MPIRAPPTTLRRQSISSALAAAALALASCGPAAPAAKQAGAAGVAAETGSGDCLAAVWQAQPAPDKAFDQAHDRADGGSISCATGTSASQFAAALAAIRAAAARGDNAALIAEIGLPLLFIDAAGRKRELDRTALAARAEEVFSPPVVALLERVRLEDLSVVPREGAFADLGAVWLVAGRTGGRPRIVTIDRQALDEAATHRRR